MGFALQAEIDASEAWQ